MCENCVKLNYRPVNSNHVNDEATINYRLEDATIKFRAFLDALGLDRNDPNLHETAERVSKMYLKELFVGTWQDKPKMTTFDIPKNQIPQGMIIDGPNTVKSLCAHHFMPIVGQCWTGVILGKSNKKGLPGLSKFSRIIEYYARRPQLQEQLTQQIHDHLESELDIGPDGGVYVVIKAKHFCKTHRGVNETDGIMTTTALSGKFIIPEVRNEFLDLSGVKHVKS